MQQRLDVLFVLFVSASWWKRTVIAQRKQRNATKHIFCERGGGDVAPLRGQVVRGGRAAHTRREGPIISRQSLTKRQDLFDYLRHFRSDA